MSVFNVKQPDRKLFTVHFYSKYVADNQGLEKLL